MLLLALLDDEELGRLARDASRELAKIKVDLLQPNLMKLVAGSPEDDGSRGDRGGLGRRPWSAAGRSDPDARPWTSSPST